MKLSSISMEPHCFIFVCQGRNCIWHPPFGCNSTSIRTLQDLTLAIHLKKEKRVICKGKAEPGILRHYHSRKVKSKILLRLLCIKSIDHTHMLILGIFPGDFGTQPNLIPRPKSRSTRLRYADNHKRAKNFVGGLALTPRLDTQLKRVFIKNWSTRRIL